MALTALGVVLTVVGVTLWIIPILPGGFLAYIGIPLLFAVSPRHESRLRRWIKNRLLRLRVRWWRFRP